MSKKIYTEEVAKNPNTSPDILRKILERGKDDWVSWYAADNHNCPPEALKMVLERGKNDNVSGYAGSNPNCPPESKLQWKKIINGEETGEIIPQPKLEILMEF